VGPAGSDAPPPAGSSPTVPTCSDVGASFASASRAHSRSAAGTIEQALLALVLRPVITGVNWYGTFDTPDVNGLVQIKTGSYVRGGHEIVADEIIVPVAATVDDLDAIATYFGVPVGSLFGDYPPQDLNAHNPRYGNLIPVTTTTSQLHLFYDSIPPSLELVKVGE
jgi:hypothetical protein